MAKQFFKNLPDTSTPLTATRFNGLLDGDESQGNLVVDSIRSKNMFDKSTIVAGDITGSNTGNRLSSRQVLWLEAGTYTFSCNIASPYRYDILVQNTGIPPLSSATTFIYDAGWKTASNPTTTFTINTAGWVTISFSKEDSSALTPSNVAGFNYQLEKGSVATTYSPYQNLDGQEIEDFKSRVTFNMDATSAATFYKIGKMVIINYQGIVRNWAANDLLFTIPAGYRPITNVFPIYSVWSNAYGQLALYSEDGRCIINNISTSGANGRVCFQTAYLTE